ncbi:MAG: hypothetical protein EZS28_002492 [Streblomastix strix]|uniref:Uncharacterized protein n=1 Tax=Streblomastix strix TaxID=222440 RepID=A0A5J4X440_9EUKA|nr:MAG: hypothetical protein EZS28_002492 [Streblomastix strix]
MKLLANEIIPSEPSISTSQSSETTSSNIIPIPKPSVHQKRTSSKFKVPEQKRQKTGAVNETINSNAQSSRIKQIAGRSDINFGSNMDIDMEQMMERDLIHKQRITNDGPIVSKAQTYANIQHLNDVNETNIPQRGHLAAQSAHGLGFHPLIGQEQERYEDEPEQDQSQQNLSNLPDNLEKEGQPVQTQETGRSEANKGSIQPRSKSFRKKKKNR